MLDSERDLHLNLHLAAHGHHNAAWRLPDAQPERHADLEYYRELVRLAERGTFDSVFLDDGVGLRGAPQRVPHVGFEPLTLLSALATATEHVGLIATASTTYQEPYHLAHLFASLDHLSGGRAGWNIVTSYSDVDTRNVGRGGLERAARYLRAEEFLDVVTKLWDSWTDDAVVADKPGGVFADPSRVRAINHVGEHFRVAGPLTMPRPPQGYPVLAKSASSAYGRDFAARYAEVIFTGQPTLADARRFYRDVKLGAARVGRDPDQVVVMPSLYTIIGDTETAALDLAERLAAFPDGGRAPAGRHHLVVGAPEQIADRITEWFLTGAADGFTLMPANLPDGLRLFVDHVVPELRRRGLFRTAYTSSSLRHHYGLPRPTNRLPLDQPTTEPEYWGIA